MSMHAETSLRIEIPAEYVVGRDPDGAWVAVEVHGRAGGFFRTEDAAIHFAALETNRRPNAVRVAREPLRVSL